MNGIKISLANDAGPATLYFLNSSRRSDIRKAVEAAGLLRAEHVSDAVSDICENGSQLNGFDGGNYRLCLLTTAGYSI